MECKCFVFDLRQICLLAFQFPFFFPPSPLFFFSFLSTQKVLTYASGNKRLVSPICSVQNVYTFITQKCLKEETSNFISKISKLSLISPPLSYVFMTLTSLLLCPFPLIASCSTFPLISLGYYSAPKDLLHKL